MCARDGHTLGRGESEVEGLPGRDLVGILELKEKVEEGRGEISDQNPGNLEN